MRLTRLHLLTALSVGSTLPAAAQQSSMATGDSLAEERVIGEAGKRLDALLRRYESYGYSGAVLVAKDSAIVLLRGYGLADRERGISNSPATLFEMNSITKTFTGAAILQLEENATLRTADLASRHLGPFPPWKASVTLDHLANHTAGLVVEGSSLDRNSRDGFVLSVKNAPIESRPGARYRYTNAGYSVLAAVIEHATGQTYQQYVREHLFRPAGMLTPTFRGEPLTPSAVVARGYTGSPGAPRASSPAASAWGTIGAGGVVATVGDMYRWVMALQGGTIVSPPSMRKLFTPRPPPREGFGWHVEKSPWGSTFIHKGGGSADFASEILHYPDEGLTIVWASNDLRQRWRRSLNQALPAAALGRDPVVPDSAFPPPRARARVEVAPYAGTYDAANGPVYLKTGDGFLYARQNDVAIPDDVMFFPRTPTAYVGYDPAALEVVTLQFSRVPGGPVTAEFRRGRRLVTLQKRP